MIPTRWSSDRSPSCSPAPGSAWATCWRRLGGGAGPDRGPPARLVGQRPGGRGPARAARHRRPGRLVGPDRGGPLRPGRRARRASGWWRVGPTPLGPRRRPGGPRRRARSTIVPRRAGRAEGSSCATARPSGCPMWYASPWQHRRSWGGWPGPSTRSYPHPLADRNPVRQPKVARDPPTPPRCRPGRPRRHRVRRAAARGHRRRPRPSSCAPARSTTCRSSPATCAWAPSPTPVTRSRPTCAPCWPPRVSTPLLEVLVTSVDVGAAKPDPAAVAARARTARPRRSLAGAVRRRPARPTPRPRRPPACPTSMSTATPSRWPSAPGSSARPAVGSRPPAAPWWRPTRTASHERRIAPGPPHQAAGVARPARGGRHPAGRPSPASSPPPVPEPAVVAVFAGDHGVLAAGVSPWPQEVTAQMVANFTAGGAAVNVLARHAGAEVTVVDVGRGHPAARPRAASPDRRVARGTANLAQGPAMTRVEALLALDVGAEMAGRALAGGAGCLITGDMGIGNTTPSAALIAAITGPTARRGHRSGHRRRRRRCSPARSPSSRRRSSGSPSTAGRRSRCSQQVGGFEIAAIAGFIVGGAAGRVPVIVDGVIAEAAPLVAVSLAPTCSAYLVAGHRSIEPGASAALDHLGPRAAARPRPAPRRGHRRRARPRRGAGLGQAAPRDGHLRQRRRHREVARPFRPTGRPTRSLSGPGRTLGPWPSAPPSTRCCGCACAGRPGPPDRGGRHGAALGRFELADEDDPGLFGPDSVTWRIHADNAMFVGGLRALLLQTMHPLAMAGVAQHSNYRRDPSVACGAPAPTWAPRPTDRPPRRRPSPWSSGCTSG